MIVSWVKRDKLELRFLSKKGTATARLETWTYRSKVQGVQASNNIGTTYLAYWTVYSAGHSVALLAGQVPGLEAGLDGMVQEGAQWELLWRGVV